jgi:hypothetical protein
MKGIKASCPALGEIVETETETDNEIELGYDVQCR